MSTDEETRKRLLDSNLKLLPSPFKVHFVFDNDGKWQTSATRLMDEMPKSGTYVQFAPDFDIFQIFAVIVRLDPPCVLAWMKNSNIGTRTDWEA
jgi:hypothetical protein